MLTYQINPYKAPHKEATPKTYLNQDNTLGRQLERCKLKIGDKVRVRSAHNGRARIGTVDHLLTDASKIEWKKNGSQPCFIAVRLPLLSQIDGSPLTYGNEIGYFPLKQLRHQK